VKEPYRIDLFDRAAHGRLRNGENSSVRIMATHVMRVVAIAARLTESRESIRCTDQ
jgi:hypothetical protein